MIFFACVKVWRLELPINEEDVLLIRPIIKFVSMV